MVAAIISYYNFIFETCLYYVQIKLNFFYLKWEVQWRKKVQGSNRQTESDSAIKKAKISIGSAKNSFSSSILLGCFHLCLFWLFASTSTSTTWRGKLT